MSRQEISHEELVATINEVMREHEECANCQVTSITKTSEADEDGCNWSSPMLRCSGVPVDVCNSIVDSIVADLRPKFNVS